MVGARPPLTSPSSAISSVPQPRLGASVSAPAAAKLLQTGAVLEVLSLPSAVRPIPISGVSGEASSSLGAPLAVAKVAAQTPREGATTADGVAVLVKEVG